MEQHERAYHAHRVASGETHFRHGGVRYVLGRPTPSARAYAEAAGREAWGEAALAGLLSDDEALDLLRSRGLWTAEMARRLDRIPADLDDARVALCEGWGEESTRLALKGAIATLVAEAGRLSGVRSSLSHATIGGAAASARIRALAAASLRLPSGAPAWDDPDDAPPAPVDAAIAAAARDRLGESGIRELARTDPWREIWSAGRHAGGALAGPACDLSDEQRLLLLWSGAYDNARQHTPPPPEGLLDDDDAFDGWMILRRRERDDEDARGKAERSLSPKVAGCDQVYLPVKDVEAARRLDRSLNTGAARAVKQERFEAVRRHGEVREQDMPDTRLRRSGVVVNGK